MIANSEVDILEQYTKNRKEKSFDQGYGRGYTPNL